MYASRWGNMPAEEYNFAYENNLLCAIVGEKRLKNGELYIHWKNKKVYNKKVCRNTRCAFFFSLTIKIDSFF